MGKCRFGASLFYVCLTKYIFGSSQILVQSPNFYMKEQYF